jgi:hypothetical protein
MRQETTRTILFQDGNMIKRTSFYGSFTLLLICIALSLGCPQAEVDRPPTHPVTGTVTYNGEPVEGANVTFVAAGEGQGAAAVTDASGKYSLSTFASGDGAVAGEYGVKIVKFEGGAAEAAGDAGAEPMEPGGVPDEMLGGGEEGEDTGPKDLLPEKYADPSTSGLSATVAEGSNTFDFPLAD